MSPRTVLITGANSGIGYATAKVLADAKDAYHIFVAGRNQEAINTAAAEIDASKTNAASKITPVLLDVVDDASIAGAVALVEKEVESLDVLVNNAGVAGLGQDLRSRMTNTFNTNVLGAALVAAAFRPLLLKSSNPYSLYISSGAGSIGRAEKGSVTFEGEEAYRMSKAAMNMLAVWENVEHGKKGLKVFAVCPGFVVSNLRGKDEASRTGWGKAGSADVSGKLILSIIDGERDADVGGFVHKEGTYPW